MDIHLHRDTNAYSTTSFIPDYARENQSSNPHIYYGLNSTQRKHTSTNNTTSPMMSPTLPHPITRLYHMIPILTPMSIHPYPLPVQYQDFQYHIP